MNEVKVVIGNGYGDEGKGLLTDYYCSQMDNPINVRFNGGAQAGHTVITPNWGRHVFSHFGAGTFTGATTYLSEHFVINPILFMKELKELRDIGIEPKIVVHPNCLITTPYDMLINQSLEKWREGDLHGSCGVGFGETLERSKQMKKFDLHVGELYSVAATRYSSFNNLFADRIRQYLKCIVEQYIPSRIDLKKVSSAFIDILSSEALVNDFIDNAVSPMFDAIDDMVGYAYLHKKNLVLEGAQGLLLDQYYGEFPHVTRSNCGMKNANEVLKYANPWLKGSDVTVNYVTRTYQTRHGAGPLAHEDVKMSHNIQDNTNVKNEWQGALRIAPLNWGLIESVSDKDFALFAPVGAKRIRTVTCLDQLNPEASVVVADNNGVQYFHKEIWENQLVPQMFDMSSSGPTRKDVKIL